MSKKSLFSKTAAVAIVVSMLFSLPVMAATEGDSDEDNGIQKTVTVTEDGTTVIEGMISNPYNASNNDSGVAPQWLAYGPLKQYPAEGGIWQYGFWDAKVRSYYIVLRVHGSSVELNGELDRSIDTSPDFKSIAEKWAIQTPEGQDRYYYRVCD